MSKTWDGMLPILMLSIALAGFLNDVADGRQIHPLLRQFHHKRGSSGCSVSGVTYPSGHTMCLSPASNMTPKPLTDAEQAAVVEKHNSYRSEVRPKPTNMMKMYWDEDIAKVAQAWAETCPTTSHPHDSDRTVPAYGINIGQNGAFGQSDYVAAVANWYSEEKDFTYGGSNALDDVGHFTQVVAGPAVAIGCGAAKCPDNTYPDVFFCNYAYGQSDIDTPYAKGRKGCAKTCGSNCVDNLCDCGNKICLNGGTLNLSTCNCDCLSIYSGVKCQSLECPATAESFCGYDPKYCADFPDVQATCPFTCGICS